MVTAPVAPEILILLPATMEVTPVFDIVTAPVDDETPIPDPATFEVTPVLVIVTVSVALATVEIPVPPATSTESPSFMVWLDPESAVKVHDEYVPAGVDQVLSPLKKVVALAVPLAERSLVIVPEVVIVPPVTSTNVPELVATEVTVPAN